MMYLQILVRQTTKLTQKQMILQNRTRSEGEGSDKESGKELSDHEVVDDLVEDKDEEDLDLDEVLKSTY